MKPSLPNCTLILFLLGSVVVEKRDSLQMSVICSSIWWELLCVADKSAKYDVEVKNITIEPYPAVSGEDVTFIVPAIANQEITTAFVVVTVSFHGIPVHVERNDVCSQLKCPIGPGSFTLENTELLPTLTPPGSYKIKLQFLDGDDSILACAEIKFTIVWGKHLETTLESLNPLQSGS